MTEKLCFTAIFFDVITEKLYGKRERFRLLNKKFIFI
jgi:hypothetical protein